MKSRSNYIYIDYTDLYIDIDTYALSIELFRNCDKNYFLKNNSKDFSNK